MSDNPVKAYKNLDFLNSPQARTIRMVCEYEEPQVRFREHRVRDTIVFFGSARSRPMDVAQHDLAHAERELARASNDDERAALQSNVDVANKGLRLARYYEDCRELARRLTEWDMNRAAAHRYYVCTGGGPGMMEAANRGAAEVDGGKSIGLGISLPFEEGVNKYVSPELAFEFHYFFTRKYWFTYLAKAMAVFPGGFGTMDELFETLTLRQTGKIKKPMPTILFGTEYWNSVLNIQAMVEWGTISEKDLQLYLVTDSVDEAFNFLVHALEQNENE
ncbi:MAG: LOG family protein [Myxococcota bacterium]|nr:LOG family protein [Myxococcota bacterium]